MQLQKGVFNKAPYSNLLVYLGQAAFLGREDQKGCRNQFCVKEISMQAIYDEILQLVKTKEGFDFEAYKMPMLIRRIENRMLKTNTQNSKKYLSYLQQTEGESQALLSNFLINVSHFFRDPLVFNYMYANVIPDVVARIMARGQNSIRIWSAGCASGEEAYSLAILLNEYLVSEKIEVSIDFFATDYDPLILKKARKALFSANALEDTRLKYIDKYFKPEGDKFALNEDIKKKVQFSLYNLLESGSYAPSESIFGEFDLILCRNVLIYFQEEAQNRIFTKLHKAMSSGGILVLGEAELPPVEFQSKFQQVNDCCKIYRKRSNEN